MPSRNAPRSAPTSPTDTPQPVDLRPTVLVVTVAPTDPGLHRAGRHWPTGTTRVPLAEVTGEQLERLHAEPRLDIALVGEE